MAKKRKIRPTYQTKKENIDVKMHDLMRALEMMDRHKKYGKFKSTLRSKNAVVSLPPKTVNYIKKFVLDNAMHENKLGAKIVNVRADSDDPYDCDF